MIKLDILQELDNTKSSDSFSNLDIVKGKLSRMIDQKIIPHKFEFFDAKTCEQMYVAIKDMIVRGAPAIGIAGAHGVVLAALELQKQNLDFQTFKAELAKKADYLKSSRPTAVNLAWALEKQMGVLNTCSSINEAIKKG